MARKKCQRVSYVLPLANKKGGHRLGINGLAVDKENSILYTGGRDGEICAWDLDFDLQDSRACIPSPSLKGSSSVSESRPSNPTKFRSQVQAHTHWVNDIVLTQQNSAIVSASSDVTVKVWRPRSEQGSKAQTIGRHSDYVKCLTVPHPSSTWVASGGLDHKICLWDLSGAGQTMQINVGKSVGVHKGSIYALQARGTIIASGGPENVVRMWDSKSGKSITKLVGHTDNVRDILISEDGDTVMTASSDQTVKVWSLTAGRCSNTLTMHNDSVWSLFSDHPQLSVFYSSDRSGLVAKTDTRGAAELDEGTSVAVLQENDGVHKVVAAGAYIWTATSSSSINRWNDVDTQAEIQPYPLEFSEEMGTFSAGLTPTLSPRRLSPTKNRTNNMSTIPSSALLQLSISSPFPAIKVQENEKPVVPQIYSIRKPPEVMVDTAFELTIPHQEVPEETIEGQNGLIKHIMLNDRKRVLTLDSSGEVVLWDLLKCLPIKSFGKQHLEDVFPQVNTVESVAHWCTVDTRTGRLTVVLEENNYLDAEVYADEADVADFADFREDQRINLGKWAMRNLFTALIYEEVKRDEAHRKELMASNGLASSLQRHNIPSSIIVPGMGAYSGDSQDPSRSLDGSSSIPATPGLSIGIATPHPPPLSAIPVTTNPLPPTVEEQGSSQQDGSWNDTSSNVGTKPDDYFSPNTTTQPSDTSSETNPKIATTPGERGTEMMPSSPADDKDDKKKTSLFVKKLQKNFSTMKLGRSSGDSKQIPARLEERPEDASDKSSEKEKTFEESFFGVVQRIRHEYDEQLRAQPDGPLTIGITPSLPDEAPLLNPPQHTLVLVQEDDPEAGGVVDIYRGAIGVLGEDADVIEKVAPAWLGDLLLRVSGRKMFPTTRLTHVQNQTPFKESVKVSFTLQPASDELPNISAADGRLNANRMLRAKKILAYIAERIEAKPTEPEADPLKPEEYLEIYCHDQLVPPNMTLATLRTHVWRTGGDVALVYKANGKKVILPAPRDHPLAAVNG